MRNLRCMLQAATWHPLIIQRTAHNLGNASWYGAAAIPPFGHAAFSSKNKRTGDGADSEPHEDERTAGWRHGTQPSTGPLSSELFTRFWIEKKAFGHGRVVKLEPNKSPRG